MSQDTSPETALLRTTPDYWRNQVIEAAAAGTNDNDDLKYALKALHYNLGRQDYKTGHTDVSHTSALDSQLLKSGPGHSQGISGWIQAALLGQLDCTHRRQTPDHRRGIAEHCIEERYVCWNCVSR